MPADRKFLGNSILPGSLATRNPSTLQVFGSSEEETTIRYIVSVQQNAFPSEQGLPRQCRGHNVPASRSDIQLEILSLGKRSRCLVVNTEDVVKQYFPICFPNPALTYQPA